MRKSFIILLSAIFLGACGTIRFPKPDGFAEYRDRSRIYRAITPEGVRLKVRYIKSEARGTTKMWAQSVEYHLQGQGYHRTARQTVTSADGMRGECAEFLHRYHGRNVAYFVCVFVRKGRICTVECGGQVTDFGKYRKAVLEAISRFHVYD